MTLVLLPGMDGTGALFEPLLAALSPEFKTHVVRYPVEEPLGYAELEAIARAALPTDQPFVILGESFSGPIAVALAAARPPNLKGLVLCCSFVRNPRPLLASLRLLVTLVPVRFVPIQILSRFLLGQYSSARLRSALAEALARVSSTALRARVRAVLATDVSSKLASTTVPTLYMRAARDRVVPRAASALVSSLSPRARVVELEGPHFLLQAAPKEAAQVIGSFIREVQVAL